MDLPIKSHPTQILADFLTMREHCNKDLSQVCFTYLGNSRFNMANSLMIGAAIMGMDCRIIAPKSLQPEIQYQEMAQKFAQKSGAKITVTDNIAEGVKGCGFSLY